MGSPAPQRAYELACSSTLGAAREQVWAHATSMRGVNRELFPLARMTYPRQHAAIDPIRIELGRRLFRSWILAGWILPIDYDDLTFIEFEPGRRFLERSPMLTQREWQHERIVDPAGDGCTVTDRVRFVPRAAVLGPLFLATFRFAFRLRHRNLRRLFAAPRTASDTAAGSAPGSAWDADGGQHSEGTHD